MVPVDHRWKSGLLASQCRVLNPGTTIHTRTTRRYAMILARIQETLFIVQIQGLSFAIRTFRMYCTDLEVCTITSMQSSDYVHTR